MQLGSPVQAEQLVEAPGGLVPHLLVPYLHCVAQPRTLADRSDMLTGQQLAQLLYHSLALVSYWGSVCA